MVIAAWGLSTGIAASVAAVEHEIESLVVVGNGLVGSRGSLAEGSPLSEPSTLVAGVFETPRGAVPELVRVPDWFHVVGTVDGARLRLDAGQLLEHRRVLDLRQGITWRHWRQRDEADRVTRIDGMRLASLADLHLLQDGPRPHEVARHGHPYAGLSSPLTDQ